MHSPPLHACRILAITAEPAEILQTCDTLGAGGYLLGQGTEQKLLLAQDDADRIKARFADRATLQDGIIRVKALPKGVLRLTPRTSTRSIGQIDTWEPGPVISGWFHPDRIPGRLIRIRQGTRLLAETEANLFRHDLFEAGIPDGVAGFRCPCPDLAADGGEITLYNADDVLLAKTHPPKATQDLRLGAPITLTDGALPGAEDSGHYRAALDGFALDYVLATGRAPERMIVFSPGFLRTDRFPYPYFQRMKWAQELAPTCVFLADPTLLLGRTQIGWFLGDRKTHYMPAVAHHIEALARSRGIAPGNITFFGSSAGGFSSIGFAAHLKGARAVAANPQTNALRLHNPAELAATLDACFELRKLDEARAQFGPRLILSEMFRSLGHIPRITIWQNFYDRYHMEHHLLPFLNELRDLSPAEMIDVHMAAQPEDGHNPPTLAQIRHLFDS